ncbi:hypothetical protein BKA66DRAFT_566514 [Pyrenochaeta sp. MPI-SDFR-AT-0127]|nr:hypothetical protein BKA66DRAFT_566514 [Pyrenochaeta sp. MPI-SDFR-AT-0127]
MTSKHEESTNDRPTESTSHPVDPELPGYYDSEPSSQPPKYNNAATSNATGLQPPPRPKAHQTGSGASAATVAAILASPSPPQDEKEKKSLNERWRDWKERWRNSEGRHEDYGSSRTWNVQGVSVRDWGSTAKAKRR